jgi:hypothetical protein|tara:strand:+ start:1716 stop:1910 length:195 start_codon:yes stop_codon:yes gene_type:complete
MKDLGEKLRSGSVQKFNGEQLGIKTQGKGSFPRTSPTNKNWQENYDKIFGKKDNKKSKETTVKE